MFLSAMSGFWEKDCGHTFKEPFGMNGIEALSLVVIGGMASEENPQTSESIPLSAISLLPLDMKFGE